MFGSIVSVKWSVHVAAIQHRRHALRDSAISVRGKRSVLVSGFHLKCLCLIISHHASATNPACITGVLQWVHGNYSLLDNGSITMQPYPDGFQQIQDPCAPQSNFIDPGYNYTEMYQSWRIFQDPVTGYKLHLFQSDGKPVAPLFLISASPNMLPTTTLRKQPAAPATTSDGLISGGGNGTKRSLGGMGHQKRWTWSWGL
jgi:hypothetical protein